MSKLKCPHCGMEIDRKRRKWKKDLLTVKYPNILRQRREELGKTVLEAAVFLGFKSDVSVFRMENGTQSPLESRVPYIETFYEAPIEELYPELFAKKDFAKEENK